MNYIKDKLNSAWTWVKVNVKKTLIVIGILGIAGAAGIMAIPPTPLSIDTSVRGQTYYAEIDNRGIVLRVIVADKAFIDSGLVGNPSKWIETSKDGSVGKNPARTGIRFNQRLKTFIYNKPTTDAIFDDATASWIIPRGVLLLSATST